MALDRELLDREQTADILEYIKLEMTKTALRWDTLDRIGLGKSPLGEMYVKRFHTLRQRKAQLVDQLREMKGP